MSEPSAPPCWITIKSHGPLRVEGEFALCDAQGCRLDVEGRGFVFLCRCGASRQKPFCDGSHNRVGFVSVVEAGPELHDKS